jgi:hypothetical protein
MHMANTRDVLVENRQWIATGEGDVTGVEEQAHGFVGEAHQAIDVRRCFHISAHVMVVSHPDAARERVFGKGVQARCVLVPAIVGEEARALIQRLR